MATFGLTPYGLRIKRLEEIIFELGVAFRGEFGEETNIDPETSILGQYIGVFAEREALLWELALAVYFAAYPDSAEGTSLDNVAALTAIERLPATKSSVVVTCAGTVGTTIPGGRIVSVSGTGAKFKSTTSVVIGLDGTVDVDFEALEAGAVQAPAGSLSNIETPVTGWNSATNDEDAAVGREIETDLELRTRRRSSLRVIGAATLEAIRSRILDEVPGVEDALVYENDSDSIVEGRPPHSIQVVVNGGETVAVAQKIFDLKAAGIETYGLDESETIIDSQGFEHVIKFDRATEVRVFMHVRITVGSAFNLGAKQKQKIKVATNNPGETLTLTINGRDFPVTTGATPAATATLLLAALQAVGADWLPLTFTQTNPGTDDFFFATADFPGNPFVVTWASSGSSSITVETVTLNAGDQSGIVADVIEFAEGDEDTVREQGIGRAVYRARYFGPINYTSDIHTIEIFLASGLEDSDYWPTTAPPAGGDWAAADITLSPNEIAEFDSFRVTIEVI